MFLHRFIPSFQYPVFNISKFVILKLSFLYFQVIVLSVTDSECDLVASNMVDSVSQGVAPSMVDHSPSMVDHSPSSGSAGSGSPSSSTNTAQQLPLSEGGGQSYGGQSGPLRGNCEVSRTSKKPDISSYYSTKPTSCNADADNADVPVPVVVFYFLGFAGIMPFLFLMATVPYISSTVLSDAYFFVEGVIFWRNFGTLIGCVVSVVCAHKQVRLLPNFYIATIGQATLYLLEATVFGYLASRTSSGNDNITHSSGNGAKNDITHPSGNGANHNDDTHILVLVRVATFATCFCGICSAMMNALSLSFVGALNCPKLAGGFSMGQGIAGIVAFLCTLVPLHSIGSLAAQIVAQVYYACCILMLLLSFFLARATLFKNQTIHQLLHGETPRTSVIVEKKLHTRSPSNNARPSKDGAKLMLQANATGQDNAATIGQVQNSVASNGEEFRNDGEEFQFQNDEIKVTEVLTEKRQTEENHQYAEKEETEGGKGFLWLAMPMVAALFFNNSSQFVVYPNVILEMRVGSLRNCIDQPYFNRICIALVPFLDVVGRFFPIVIKATPPPNPRLNPNGVNEREDRENGDHDLITSSKECDDETQALLVAKTSVVRNSLVKTSVVRNTSDVTKEQHGDIVTPSGDIEQGPNGPVECVRHRENAQPTDEKAQGKTNCGHRFMHLFHKQVCGTGRAVITNSAAGNRTRVIRVTGGYTNHYTTAESVGHETSS